MPQHTPNWQQNRITTDATTVVLSGTGTLYGVFIESLGTSPATITIYDNTAGSGTIIAILDGDLAANQNVFFPFTRRIATGITVVTSAGAVKTVVSIFYDTFNQFI